VDTSENADPACRLSPGRHQVLGVSDRQRLGHPEIEDMLAQPGAVSVFSIPDANSYSRSLLGMPGLSDFPREWLAGMDNFVERNFFASLRVARLFMFSDLNGSLQYLDVIPVENDETLPVGLNHRKIAVGRNLCRYWS